MCIATLFFGIFGVNAGTMDEDYDESELELFPEIPQHLGLDLAHEVACIYLNQLDEYDNNTGPSLVALAEHYGVKETAIMR